MSCPLLALTTILCFRFCRFFFGGGACVALRCFVCFLSKGGKPQKKKPKSADWEPHARLFACLTRAFLKGMELELVVLFASAMDPTYPMSAPDTRDLAELQRRVPDTTLGAATPHPLMQEGADGGEGREACAVRTERDLVMQLARELNKHVVHLKFYNHTPRLALSSLFARYRMHEQMAEVVAPLFLGSKHGVRGS